MKVRTLQEHSNGHPPVYVKMPGRKYELPDTEAQTLIDAGRVEEYKPASKKSEPDEG